jgi:ribosomal protein S12
MAAGSAVLPGAQKRVRLRRMYQLLRSSKKSSIEREALIASKSSSRSRTVCTRVFSRDSSQRSSSLRRATGGAEASGRHCSAAAYSTKNL